MTRELFREYPAGLVARVFAAVVLAVTQSWVEGADVQLAFGPLLGLGLAAGLGGLGNFLGAKEANKPRTAFTDQTSTREPWSPTIQHLNRILEEASQLYEAGPPDYSSLGGGFRGVGERGGEAMDIFRRVAESGLGAGATPNMRMANEGISSVWGMPSARVSEGAASLAPEWMKRREGFSPSMALQYARQNPEGQFARSLDASLGSEWRGATGPRSGTGFEGYNPILAGLAGTLGGSSLDEPMNLLRGFLAERQANEGGAGDGSVAASGGGSFSFGSGGGGGGGVPPDLGGRGTFGRELDRIFSEEANEEQLAAVLDGVAEDIRREGFAQVADLAAAESGAGRFGGSHHTAQIAEAKERQAEEIAQISAQLRFGDLNERREARLQALSLLNSREVAAMQDMTQRAGISASSGSAAAGRELRRELAELENERLLRGQDLQAIGAMMEGQQFGLSGLMGLGERLSNDRLAALGLIPSIEQINLGGLGQAMGAGQGLLSLEEMDARARASNAANRRQIRMLELEAPQRLLNDYMRTVLGIASLGGESTVQGTNVQPGAGLNPLASGIMGGLGAGLAGAGIAGQAGLLGARG